jgi:hypothetical protein
MEITNDIIIECAYSLGFDPPKRIKVQEWNKSDPNLFPVAKMVWRQLEPSQITVNRSKTVPFAGSKDLGEWWIGYPQCLTQFRVTDSDMKVFLRDKKINQIIK